MPSPEGKRHSAGFNNKHFHSFREPINTQLAEQELLQVGSSPPVWKNTPELGLFVTQLVGTAVPGAINRSCLRPEGALLLSPGLSTHSQI